MNKLNFFYIVLFFFSATVSYSELNSEEEAFLKQAYEEWSQFLKTNDDECIMLRVLGSANDFSWLRATPPASLSDLNLGEIISKQKRFPTQVEWLETCKEQLS